MIYFVVNHLSFQINCFTAYLSLTFPSVKLGLSSQRLLKSITPEPSSDQQRDIIATNAVWPNPDQMKCHSSNIELSLLDKLQNYRTWGLAFTLCPFSWHLNLFFACPTLRCGDRSEVRRNQAALPLFYLCYLCLFWVFLN